MFHKLNSEETKPAAVVSIVGGGGGGNSLVASFGAKRVEDELYSRSDFSTQDEPTSLCLKIRMRSLSLAASSNFRFLAQAFIWSSS